MSQDHTPTQAAHPPHLPAPAPFRAVLTPYRSLGRTGFIVLMTLLAGTSFLAGIAFLAVGAWPVFGFFGLDVLLVYIAFKASYRSGRAYETVELTESALTVTQVDPAGATRTHEFNPYWVRVRLLELPDGRTDLRLALHGRELPFGRFLTNEERQELADALKGALLAARGGARI